MDLADEIEGDAEAIARDYPKGATQSDLAGYYGVPLAQIQHALNVLRRDGVALTFLKGEVAPPSGGETHQIKTGVIRPGPHPNRKEKRLPEEKAEIMRPGLESLARRYPYGATMAEVAAFFDLSAQHAYAAIQILVSEGAAAWVKDGNGPGNIFYAPGMMQMPPPLTQLQEAVYCAIRDKATDGKASINATRLAQEIGSSQGSIAQICYALELKGYLRRLTPYGAKPGAQATPGGKLQNPPSPEYEVYEPAPRTPAFAKPSPTQPAFPKAAIIARRIAEDDVIKKAVARRQELVAEIAKIDAFLETYSDLTK